MKWKKVFIDKEDWKKLIMELPRLKVEYTTQWFTVDGVTITLMVAALILGLIIGVNI